MLVVAATTFNVGVYAQEADPQTEAIEEKAEQQFDILEGKDKSVGSKQISNNSRSEYTLIDLPATVRYLAYITEDDKSVKLSCTGIVRKAEEGREVEVPDADLDSLAVVEKIDLNGDTAKGTTLLMKGLQPVGILSHQVKVIDRIDQRKGSLTIPFDPNLFAERALSLEISCKSDTVN